MALSDKTKKALEDLKGMGISVEVVEKISNDLNNNPKAEEKFSAQFLQTPEFKWIDNKLKEDFQNWTNDLNKLAELRRLKELHPEDEKIGEEINVINSRLKYEGFQDEILDMVNLKTVDKILDGLKEEVEANNKVEEVKVEEKKEGDDMGITAEQLGNVSAGLMKINGKLIAATAKYSRLAGDSPSDELIEKATEAGLAAINRGQSPEDAIKNAFGIPELEKKAAEKATEAEFEKRLAEKEKEWRAENNIVAPVRKKEDPFLNRVVVRKTTDENGKELLPYQKTALANRQEAKQARLNVVMKGYEERINS